MLAVLWLLLTLDRFLNNSIKLCLYWINFFSNMKGRGGVKLNTNRKQPSKRPPLIDKVELR